MKKTICDLCGAEVKERPLFRRKKKYDVWLESRFTIFGSSRNSWELCFDCASKIKKTMSGKGFEPSPIVAALIDSEDQEKEG